MLENIQHSAARWVCGSHWNPSINQWTILSDDSLAEPHLSTLAARGDYFSVCLLHDILTLNFSDYCTGNTSCTRAHNLCIIPLNSPLVVTVTHFCMLCFFMEYSSC